MIFQQFPPLYFPRNPLQLGQVCVVSYKSLMQQGIQAQHQNLKLQCRIFQELEFDNYPARQRPSPIIQAAKPGVEVVLVTTVAWHQVHLT